MLPATQRTVRRGSGSSYAASTTLSELILQLIDYGRPLEQAVREQRIHHQWKPDTVWHEEGLDPKLKKALEKKGHKLDTRGWRIGHANCIEVVPETGELKAVADLDRDGGSAAAY